MRFLLRWMTLAMALHFALLAHASELALKVTDKEPPKELDQTLRAEFEPKAIQLLDGDRPVYEFWFRKELPLKSRPDSVETGLDTLADADLLGAAVVHSDQRDYRDDQLYADVYTLRFALQPQDGNHLGTSEHPYFAVLVTSKLDTSPEAFTTYKPLVRASAKDTPAEHPLTLSLRPVSSEDGEHPRLTEPADDHKSIRIKLPAKAGDEKTTLVFDLVYEGKGVH